MPMTEPLGRFAEDDFDILLGACREQIALFAFTQYKEAGRGVVTLERQGHEEDILHDKVDLGYGVYVSGKPDAATAGMIKAYDPAWEIVFQYLQTDGNVRTVRIRTAPSNRHPWRIYLFEQLVQGEEQ
ncbi:hypothetical protein [Desulfobulbus alkaliphilus]|uniref:hypothetical protein n=1 Tax=Desulfobulbus alkaliphilus TaxID=869814 RepID=UPI0019642366|nr:hypothetical protein [Desulfobulbus alkaliphilus]MBM9535987.1 hypothetical protein [Desulfobulbus alkaliphilus]